MPKLPRKGHVYVLEAQTKRFRGRRLVKLGRTGQKEPHDRVKQIQDEWKRKRRIEVEVVHIEKVKDSFQGETELHRTFKPYAIANSNLRAILGSECNGDSEWFLVPHAKFSQVVKHADSLGEPCINPWVALIATTLILFLGFSLYQSTRPASQDNGAPGHVAHK